jgi:predicted MFS family arabinose efflux permease
MSQNNQIISDNSFNQENYSPSSKIMSQRCHSFSPESIIQGNDSTSSGINQRSHSSSSELFNKDLNQLDDNSDHSTPLETTEPESELSLKIIILFAISAGTIVMNLYYTQPLLGQITDFFHITYSKASLMTTLTQIGYAYGMIFIVPIADIVEKRKLICTMLIFSTVFLIIMTFSSNYYLSLVTSYFIGVTSTTTQILIPIAARMAGPAKRGKAVGGIMAGLLIGILASRVFSGLVGKNFGWRIIFGVAAILVFIICLIL